MPIWEVYAYWNITELQGMFSAIEMITASADYIDLIYTLFLVGLFAVALGYITNGKDPLAPWRWLFIAIFLYIALIVPKVDVALIDRTGTVPAVTVSNVPLIAGVLGSLTSKIGDYLTTSYETTMQVVTPSYATPGIPFGGNGLLFGHKIIEEASYLSSSSAAFNQSMIVFYEKCVFPEFDSGGIAPEDVMQSNDMWSQVSNVNPGLFVNLYNDNGTPETAVRNCLNAYNYLSTKLATQADVELGRVGHSLYPQKTEPLAKTAFEASLAGTFRFFASTSESAVNIFKQRLAANIFLDASSSSVTNYAVSQAEVSARVNYSVLAEIAKSTMPKLRNYAEIILYSLLPIVLILIILAGEKALVVLKSYIIVLMSIQLWAPLYAVMNYMLSSYRQKEILASTDSASALSIMYSNLINSGSQSDLDIAGMLAMSIPMIALAVMKGGEMAMTSAISGMLAPAQQAASNSAREMATGNLSAGNVSLDNSNYNTDGANKSDISPEVTNGPVKATDMSGIKKTSFQSGHGDPTTVIDTTGIENKGSLVELMNSTNKTNSLGRSFQQTTQEAYALENQANYKEAGISQRIASETKGFDAKSVAGKVKGITDTSAAERGFNASVKAQNVLEDSNTFTSEQAAQAKAYIQTELKGGVGIAQILSAGWESKAGLSASFTATSKDTAALKNAYSEVDSTDMTEGLKLQQALTTDKNLRDEIGVSESTENKISGSQLKQAELSNSSKASYQKASQIQDKWETSKDETESLRLNIASVLGMENLTELQQNALNGNLHREFNDLSTAINSGNYNEAARLQYNIASSLDALSDHTTSMGSNDNTLGTDSTKATNGTNDIKENFNANSAMLTVQHGVNTDKVGVGTIEESVDNKSTDLENQKIQREIVYETEAKWQNDVNNFMKDDLTVNTGNLTERPTGLADATMSNIGFDGNTNERAPSPSPLKGPFDNFGPNSHLESARLAPYGQRNGDEVKALLEDKGLYSDNYWSNDEFDFKGLKNSHEKGEFTKEEFGRLKETDGFDDSAHYKYDKFLDSLPDDEHVRNSKSSK